MNLQEKFLGVGAIFAGILGAWAYIKGLGTQISGLFIEEVQVIDGIRGVLSLHLRHNYKRFRNLHSTINTRQFIVGSDSIFSLVPFRMPNMGIASLLYGRRGIFIFIYNKDGRAYITTIKGLADFDGLISDAVAEDRIQRNRSIERGGFMLVKCIGTASDAPLPMIQRPDGILTSDAFNDYDHSEAIRLGVDKSFMYELNDYYTAGKESALKGLTYTESQLEVIHHCEMWWEREHWYKEHAIPWKTGILLHGPGGTGKSTLAKVVAQTLHIPLYEYYLSTLRDTEFINNWDSMRTPCVALLDDFDTVFHGRNSITNHKCLDFETILKQISGISSHSGIILFITTNHLEKIDPAIGQLDAHGRSTRPGRIDKIIHLGTTSIQQRREMSFLSLGYIDESIVAQGEGCTAAQFQAICIEKALMEQPLGGHT